MIDGVEISRDTHWSKVVNLVNSLEDPKMIETIINSDERNGVKKACLERLEELGKSKSPAGGTDEKTGA